MNLLYAIFIKPLEVFIGFVFGLLTGTGMGYGPALMALSLVVTAVTGPFYYLAEKWKRQEEIVQRKMAKDLASIKAHYTGQKRFYLTQNAHRLHGYSPLSPLRTSLGLLIQIPFFFAPYLYLSRYAGYAGERFLVLADLGKSDGLLLGVNLLPFLMTAINVASSLLYTKNRTSKDTFQLLAMAGLFLVVLYDSPSALLLYWTMNNIFAIPKNAILAKLLPLPPRESRPGEGEPKESFLAATRRWLEREDRATSLFLAAFFLLGVQVYWELTFERSFKFFILFTALVGFGLTGLYAWRVLRRKRPASGALILSLAAEWALFAVAAYLLLFARRQNAYISNKSVKLVTVLTQDLVIYTAALGLLPQRPTAGAGGARPALPEAVARGRAGLFGFAFAFMTAYLFLISPTLIYFSSPQDIGMGLGELFLRNALPALLFFLVGFGFFFLLGARSQAKAIGGVTATILVILVYNYILPGDYGTLDELRLEKDYLLGSPRLIMILLDVTVVGLACFAARAVLKWRKGTILAALTVVTAAFAVQITVTALRTEPTELGSTAAAESAALPPESEAIHRFSATGPNVVLVIADMFNGNYVGRLVEKYPEYRDALEGFTWYPNTLAISSTTVTSIPSMLSGYGYVPEAMNRMPGKGLPKYEAAVYDLCDAMLARRLDTSIVDLTYVDRDALSAHYQGKLRTSASIHYVGAWKARTGYSADGETGSGKNRLLVMVTLFQSAPTLLKAAIYDDGSWLIFRKSYQLRKMARNQVKTYAYLDLLPSLSTAAEGPGTFKLIHTQFTHEPFGITREGTIVKDDFPDPETGTKSFVDGRGAFNNAKKMVDFILAWTDWMKANGVWENTTIVVVSDHGNNAMDGGIALPKELSNPIADWEVSKAAALLLIKRPGEAGPLRVDERFLSNADTAAVLRRAAGIESARDATVGPAVPGVEYTYSRYYGKWNDFLVGDQAALSTYTVVDDMRVKENWRKK